MQNWLDRIPVLDPIERRQATVFQLVLLSWIILASLGVPATFQPSAEAPPVSPAPLPPALAVLLPLLLVAGVLLWVCPVTALVLLRLGRFRLSVIVATLGLLLTHSIATVALGVTNGSVLIMFQIPIALAGLLAGRRLLLAVAGASIALVLLVGYLESRTPPMAGFFTHAFVSAEASAALRQTIGMLLGFFVAVTVILTVLLDRFGSALRQALRSALEREDELRAIRASLEATVAERTSALQRALDEVQARAAEQTRLLSEIDEQRTMIKELSVPVIPIDTRTLVMPLVGALDSTRLRHLQEQSLKVLERSSARTLVLDITGVPVVDSHVAQGLLTTVRSARLLGAEVLLVGIRPEVAQTIIGLGIDLHNVQTFSDLHSALGQIAA